MEKNKPVSDGMGTASMILGVIGILFALSFFLSFFGIVVGIVGLSLAIAQRRIHKTTMSKAGLVLNIIGLIGNGLMVLLILLIEL